MNLKRFFVLLSVFGIITFSVFAQNETSSDFVRNTVLARQAGSSLDKFPKMEIGFVGRNTTTEPMAFLFMRLQSTLETGGGVFTSFYQLNRNTNQLEKREGSSLEQFFSLVYSLVMAADLAKMRDTATIDMEVGEIELADFQWYMTQNQWKYTRNKAIRIKVKIQTVNREHRLYFYRTSDVRDYRNEFETFTMPDDVYLTLRQCQQITDDYQNEGSSFWRAIDIAIDSVKRTMR
jgi:hypothetical protein